VVQRETVQKGCTGEQRTGAVKIRVDTSGTTFMAAALARPVTDYETKQHRVDDNGELLYNLQVVQLDPDGAQVIVVKMAGDPQVGQGAMLEFEGLVAIPWSQDGRSGVSFRTDRVKAVGVAGGSPNSRASEKAAA
jgi:hypothetical protein